MIMTWVSFWAVIVAVAAIRLWYEWRRDHE